jgi:hypothetical protein
MVDNVNASSVEFLGNKQKTDVYSEKKVMSVSTQDTLVEATKNYNRLVNNMFASCGKICIKNFNNNLQLNQEEKSCIENCHKKFYNSYAIGESILGYIMKEAEKADVFSDIDEVNLVSKAKK